jgi:hypothetical protein
VPTLPAPCATCFRRHFTEAIGHASTHSAVALLLLLGIFQCLYVVNGCLGYTRGSGPAQRSAELQEKRGIKQPW